jgi:hypothetical protein
MFRAREAPFFISQILDCTTHTVAGAPPVSSPLLLSSPATAACALCASASFGPLPGGRCPLVARLETPLDSFPLRPVPPTTAPRQVSSLPPLPHVQAGHWSTAGFTKNRSRRRCHLSSTSVSSTRAASCLLYFDRTVPHLPPYTLVS